MQNITNSAELKNAIQILDVEQYRKGQELKEQFYQTYESLKTVNLLKSSLKEVVSSPFLIDNILGTAMGLATGYFSKKIILGVSGQLVKKLLGSILKFGIAKVVTQPPTAIKSIGQFITQHFLPKKK